jgi:hypothetical protein
MSATTAGTRRVPRPPPGARFASRRHWRAATALTSLLTVAAPALCGATIRCGDCDADGVVRIDELVSAVDNALSAVAGRRQSATGPFQIIPPGYIVQATTTEYIVRRAIVDFAAANLEQIRIQFRFVPHFEGGQLTSYRPIDIPPGSLLDQLGFARLDFIDAVNGISVAAERFDIADLLSADEVLVQIRRDRKEILLRFSIVP